VVTTKASFRDVVPEGAQTLRGIDHSVRHFPIEIDDLSVEGHQEERAPGAGPLEIPKGRSKLLNTMGDTGVEGKEQLITGLAGC